jgi:chitin synthase
MEVEVVSAREDVEALWAASRQALRAPQPEVKEHRDAATKQLDHDRNSRTNVVLAWIGTNMLMIVVFTSDFFLAWADEHFTTASGGTLI